MDRPDFNRQLADAAGDMSTEPTTMGTLERAVRMGTEMNDRCDAAGSSIVQGEVIETPVRPVSPLRPRSGSDPARDVLVRSLARTPRPWTRRRAHPA